jgi:glutamate dehydrogenase (NADP+)
LRVEFNSAIGPYKGGLRFHPSVNLGIIKFLGFEQIFKNALTTLPMGGGKGGSDFDPKGKSDNEVMRFCQSFMSELFRHIGADIDVPAGDIGVGGREIGFMFGQYKKLTKLRGRAHRQGAQLGRQPHPSRGDRLRPGLLRRRDAQDPRRVLQGQTRRGFRLGQRRPVRGREGHRARRQGAHLLRLQRLHRGRGRHRPGQARVRHGPEEQQARPHQGILRQVLPTPRTATDPGASCNPLWQVKCDVALPSATQNEINVEDANNLVKNGCYCVSEGANMPTTPDGINVFLESKILYGPGKAANAGGVAVSGLEMSQNSMRMAWTREEVDGKLHHIMKTSTRTASTRPRSTARRATTSTARTSPAS